MARVNIAGVGTVNIDAAPGTPQFDTAIEEIAAAHTSSTGSLQGTMVTPTPAGPTVSGSTGAVAQQARKNLANIISENSDRQETGDTNDALMQFAKDTVPSLAATVATMGMGGPAALVGKTGWKLVGALAKGAAERTGAAMVAGGAGMAASGGDTGEIKRAATEQATGQLLGEGVGLALQGVVRGTKALYNVSKASPAGQAMKEARNAERLAHANETATKLADDIGTPQNESMMTHAVQSFRDKWQAITNDEVKTGYTAAKQLLEGKVADIRDVANEVIKIESQASKWRGKAGLSTLTPPNGEWMNLVDSLRAGNSPTKAAGFADSLVGKSASVPNAAENASALVTARSAASQQLKDLGQIDNPPRELREGLQKLIDMIDTKVGQIDPAAGEAFSVAKSIAHDQATVVEQALYKATKGSGDKVATALMDGRVPTNAKDFVNMVKKVGGEEGAQLMSDVQRKVFDNILTTKKGSEQIIDLSGVGMKLNRMGDNAKVLFGENYAALDGLKKLSGDVADIFAKPTVKGTSSVGFFEKVLEAGLLRKGVSIGGGILGGMAGYAESGGSAYGAAAGMGVGLGIVKLAPTMILKIAENPTALKTFRSALKLADTKPEKAAFAASSALRMVYGQKKYQELRDAAFSEQAPSQ